MNTVDCPFEIHGYTEDLTDATTFKFLGSRPVEKPDRPCGTPGQAELVLTADVTLKRGLRTVTMHASKERPVRVWSVFQMICGRVKQTKGKEERNEKLV